jgi:aryl-alcohol dehydrogenase-like predicted oxidoreductase
VIILFRRDIEQDILPYTRAHGIAVLVYGPLGHGLLGGGYTPQTTFARDDWRSNSPVFQGEPFKRDLGVVERLKTLAQQHGMTVAQLAIAWVLANPAVDVAIVGARQPRQLAQSVPAADIHLSPNVLAKSSRSCAVLNPWAGHRPKATQPPQSRC